MVEIRKVNHGRVAGGVLCKQVITKNGRGKDTPVESIDNKRNSSERKRLIMMTTTSEK